MKKLILIVGLLVGLSGLIRSVDAQTSSIVGYGSTDAEDIHLIDLDSSSPTYGESIGSFTPHINNVNLNIPFQGLAIDPLGETLYGSTLNGKLYSINIATGEATDQGNMGLGTVEAMDFNFNRTELWVTDFDNFPAVTIYNINTSDASATLVQTFYPGINDVVRAMTADTKKDVWVANDNFPSMDFQSIDTDVSVNNITHIGFLDDDPSQLPFLQRPKIRGMDRNIDGVLYGLAEDGGIYSIDQTSGLLTLIKDTNHVWLGLAAADASPATPTIKIALDIKPKHCPNKLNVKKWKKKCKKRRHHGDDDSRGHKKKCKKKGILKAAILGTKTFNVRDIETYTIRLNGVAPGKYRYKDLTCPTVLNSCDCEALDADTFEDLVLYFKKRDIVGTLGDVQDGEEIPLLLMGMLKDGTEIEGTDCVLIVDKGDDDSSDDGSCRKKKWRKKCTKKRYRGDDDSSGH